MSKRWYFSHKPTIPDRYMNDVVSLKDYIEQTFDITTTLQDVYSLWCKVSDELSSAWMYIEFHPANTTRAEFISSRLEMYGKIITA